MYKNIIFDLGGVVVNFTPKDFLMDRFMNKKAEEIVYALTFGSKEWEDMDRGDLSRGTANRIMLENAARCGRTVDCLLQLHIAEEETKFGFSPDECRDYLASGAWRALSHVRLRGVMGMATLTDDENTVRKEFESLHRFFGEIKASYFADDEKFSEISMGMSHDYRIALTCGTTMVRVGTLIFGERNY